MIVQWASSNRLREVIIGTAERLKTVDAAYLEMVQDKNVNMRRVKNNRSERWWIVKDDKDARAELIERGEGHTIPYWAKAS